MVIGHKKQWAFLKKKFEQNQLSHAYLFTGADGIGKKLFAKEFSEFVGCKFPDLMIVAPEEGGEISIAKIREVENFLAYKSYNGGYKIVIVDQAERMNQEAQSCFLKTLEEPKGQTLLFLITSKPDLLLPTIFSRCQTIKFFKPKDLPANSEKLKKEQEILEQLTPLFDAGFAEKFKFVKLLDFSAQNGPVSGGEKHDPLEIIEVLQKHFRKKLLSNVLDEKTKKFLELSQELSNKLIFTNANPKLALEILLMEL